MIEIKYRKNILENEENFIYYGWVGVTVREIT